MNPTTRSLAGFDPRTVMDSDEDFARYECWTSTVRPAIAHYLEMHPSRQVRRPGHATQRDTWAISPTSSEWGMGPGWLVIRAATLEEVLTGVVPFFERSRDWDAHLLTMMHPAWSFWPTGAQKLPWQRDRYRYAYQYPCWAFRWAPGSEWRGLL